MSWLNNFVAFLASPLYDLSGVIIDKPPYVIDWADDGKLYVTSSIGAIIQVKDDDVIVPEGDGVHAWTAPSERPF